MNDFEKEAHDLDFLADQQIIMISVIIAKLQSNGELQFDSSIVLYTDYNYKIKFSESETPAFKLDLLDFPNENELLVTYANIVSQYKPNAFIGHNIFNFDLPIIDNKMWALDLPLLTNPNPIELPLHSRWLDIIKDHNGFTVLDTFLFAKKRIGLKYGCSLANLSWNLLSEPKLKLDKDLDHLLPVDCLRNDKRMKTLINYCLHDSILAFKLFILFQKDKIVFQSWASIKTSVVSVVKHQEVQDAMLLGSQFYNALRQQTTMCVKEYLLARYRLGQDLSKFDYKLFYHTMLSIRNLSSEVHEFKIYNNYPIRTIDTDLRDFVAGEGIYTANSNYPGYKHCVTDTFGTCHLPELDFDHISRAFEYTTQYEMWPAFELNIRRNYELYIKRFINTVMGKKEFEKGMKKKRNLVLGPELAGLTGREAQKFTSYFRFRLKILKDQILYRPRDEALQYINSFNSATHPENIKFIDEVSKVFNDDFSMLIFEQINSLMADKIPELLQRFNIIFPTSITTNDNETVDVHNLLYTVQEYPLHFLRNSLQISDYLESKGAKLYNVIPLSLENTPCFFPIDTRTLWGLAKHCFGYKNNDKKIGPLHSKVTNYMTQDQIQNMTHSQQQDYWKRWFNCDDRSFHKANFEFNNYAVTDGISICFQFVRKDLKGMKCKPDSSKASVKAQYFNECDRSDFISKQMVYVDIGKRDMLQLASKSNRETQNPLKKYNFLRLTYAEWSRVSRKHKRIHQYLVRRRSGTTTVRAGDDNPITVTMNIEKWNTWLSEEQDSKTVNYTKFRKFILAKCIHYNATKDFYALHIWRIHKIQNHVHKQKQSLNWLTAL
ncbi:hypothetical protein GEMRC1_007720 [Eukaryota sp. GEM-RC1]